MIPYNKTYIAGRELYYISEAVLSGDIKGDGTFTKRCNHWLEQKFGVHKALLTHSCTGALEMAALLLDISEGDEVILPSFTFTSTANAFVLHGAKPVFCDIRPDTLNIDERLIEGLITKKTKAIIPVHYAGVGCEMDEILQIAKKHNVSVVEDAAHAIMAKYKGQWLGAIGDIGTFSFHETKNYSSGEGGAVLLQDPSLKLRAEIIREKGTNRSQFFRGQVDKYSWVDIGSSYLPSEIIAAFLYGQLEQAEQINSERLQLWNNYYEYIAPLAARGDIQLPFIPNHCEHNAHLFYLILETGELRDEFITHCRTNNVGAVFHYIPLHTSVMGKKLCPNQQPLPHTESLSERIVRLPLFCGMTEEQQDHICSVVKEFFVGKNNIVNISCIANI